MFDYRLARVMHQDQINSALAQKRIKASESKRSDGIDWKRSTIVTMIARIFSSKAVPETNRNPRAPQYRFEQESGSR
jgi:hypothetical protein